MKSLKTIMIGLITIGLSLSVSAGDTGQQPQIETAKQQCYLDQQKSSRFCQKVMFPPIPLR